MTTVITSPRNPALRDLRRVLSRRHPGRFAAEGEDLVDAARDAGWPALGGLRAAGVEAGEARFAEVAPELLAEISLLASGTRAVGIYAERWAPAAVGPLCLHLHGVRDPGNVGGALRSARALGASCLSLGPGSADPFGPRAVRASMGAIFSLPVVRTEDPATLPGERIALDARAPDALRGPLCRPASVIVGAEREGLPDAVLAGADRVARIPMRAGDSLNAAVSAALALYELTRDPHRMACA